MLDLWVPHTLAKPSNLAQVGLNIASIIAFLTDDLLGVGMFNGEKFRPWVLIGSDDYLASLTTNSTSSSGLNSGFNVVT